ncbi:multicopper oxidase Mco (plasmid) [Peptoclostridium acidaminophilum DSM 3953]|uniref:Multicopper oxidase Mco n=1 Tax=Peptoclostridium acidaminophilum DSM 3953 TaxID=1286171 RepID=W8TB58_PEPAC|nr:multicopper oxidase domain-containing protein [Peptoclostridium acidaminophilum]AHM58090.1 multicopper oxidase Mco [Peptoclostridium acidaminophilum DSM 3953]
MEHIKKNKTIIAILTVLLISLIGLWLSVIFNMFSEKRIVLSNGFTTALKLPLLLEDEDPDPSVARYTLNAQYGETVFMKNLPASTMGYNGSYLGPILKMKQGEKVSIRVNNELDEETTVHWHGLVVPGEQDGGPHQVIEPGESWTPSFTVAQPAATLWYHPHALRTTATQVYFGLAGLIYVEDESQTSRSLPDEYGVNDFPLIVQDRNFNSDGSISYRTDMMGILPGNTVLVNGTLNPYLDIRREVVRFRVLNASNSENFVFRLSDGSSFRQIATDGGFMREPLLSKTLTLSPGERAEVLVDFREVSAETVNLLLGNTPILKLRLSGNPTGEARETIPQPDAADIPIGANPRERVFILESMGITGTINGKSFNQHRIDEEIALNETEIWTIYSRGGMMMQSGGHPFHVHGTQFQVISRNGKEPPKEEQGFKDTVFVDEGEEVRIKIRFTQPGVFMYHCHILEHEENGMMGQIKVIP